MLGEYVAPRGDGNDATTVCTFANCDANSPCASPTAQCNNGYCCDSRPTESSYKTKTGVESNSISQRQASK